MEFLVSVAKYNSDFYQPKWWYSGVAILTIGMGAKYVPDTPKKIWDP